MTINATAFILFSQYSGFAMKILLSLVLALLIVPAHARIKLDDLREAARSNNLPQLARLADKSQGDLLEMYPQYYGRKSDPSLVQHFQDELKFQP